MENHHHLYQPLLSTAKTAVSSSTTTATVVTNDSENNINHNSISSSNSNIIIRLILTISIGIISIWANHEASKGFDITIINEEVKDSFEAKRFQLFYVSNDKATRILLNTSSFVENLLYPENNYHNMKKKKKVIKHVLIKLSHNTTISTSSKDDHNYYVINISPLVLMGDAKKIDYEVKSTILRGIARIWLWNGGPPWLINGMVEHIARLAGFGNELSVSCLGDKDCMFVAHALDHCEKRNKKLIRRLNEGLSDEWADHTVDDAYETMMGKLLFDCEIK